MSDNGTEVPRLTPTQRLHEVTMQALTRAPRAPSEGVEITRNAKGDWQFTVSAATQEGESLEDAIHRAELHAGRLEESFPLSRTQTYERNNEPPARVKGKP
jgi:hypothetical protein